MFIACFLVINFMFLLSLRWCLLTSGTVLFTVLWNCLFCWRVPCRDMSQGSTAYGMLALILDRFRCATSVQRLQPHPLPTGHRRYPVLSVAESIHHISALPTPALLSSSFRICISALVSCDPLYLPITSYNSEGSSLIYHLSFLTDQIYSFFILFSFLLIVRLEWHLSAPYIWTQNWKFHPFICILLVLLYTLDFNSFVTFQIQDWCIL